MMEAAVDQALEAGETADPHLARIFFARRVNSYMGGAVLAPWDVDEIDDDWVTAFNALSTAGERKAERERVNRLFDGFRREHPTFRK